MWPCYTLFAKREASWIEEQLGKLITDDREVIENSLAQYGDLVYRDSSSVVGKLPEIDKCFSHGTVEEIVDALEKKSSDTLDGWCSTALRKMKEASPVGLKVTLKSIREGRFRRLDHSLVCDYRISLNCISKRASNDFSEGVHARLVDKDFAPKWNPVRLEDVTKDMVDSYIARLDEYEPDLSLPTSVRKPSGKFSSCDVIASVCGRNPP